MLYETHEIHLSSLFEMTNSGFKKMNNARCYGTKLYEREIHYQAFVITIFYFTSLPCIVNHASSN